MADVQPMIRDVDMTCDLGLLSTSMADDVSPDVRPISTYAAAAPASSDPPHPRAFAATKRRRREVTSVSSGEESSSNGLSSTSSGKAPSHAQSIGSERWVANLESCNLALSNSLEALTRAHSATELREAALQKENGVLAARVADLRDEVRRLEHQLRTSRDEFARVSQQAAAAACDVGGGVDASELGKEVGELKENLKAVTQILLSQGEGQLDSATMQLLKVLTAPVGGLSAVGSRSGVIGMAHKGSDNLLTHIHAGSGGGGGVGNVGVGVVSDEGSHGPTSSLSLINAAVAGPVTEAQAPPSQSASSATGAAPFYSSLSALLGPDPTFSSHFSIGKRAPTAKRPAHTFFALMLGVGVTVCVRGDRLGLSTGVGAGGGGDEGGPPLETGHARKLLGAAVDTAAAAATSASASSFELLPAVALMVRTGVVYAVLITGTLHVTLFLYAALCAALTRAADVFSTRADDPSSILPSSKKGNAAGGGFFSTGTMARWMSFK
eukprot:Rhum_TRINITY_DN15056_c3_g1::Rhum_TRINITY_DN15056_c3_g1_i1::g.135306::m.135306